VNEGEKTSAASTSPRRTASRTLVGSPPEQAAAAEEAPFSLNV
jgi:hypothetical protein